MPHAALAGLLHQYGYGLVFALIGLEAMGLPLPGEAVMVAAALYAATTHHLALGPLLAAAMAGAVLGGMAGFALGRVFGRPLLQRFGPRLGLTPDRQLLGRYLIDRSGPALILFARFAAILRSTASLLAGASGMRWPPFLLFNLLGGLAWPALYCAGAYELGHAAIRLAGRAALALGLAAAVAAVAGFWIIRAHEKRWVERAKASQDQGLRPRTPTGASGPRPAILK